MQKTLVAMIQALCSTEQMMAAGIGPVPRERAIMLLGGLRELTAVTLEAGGQMDDIADEALHSTLALLGAGPSNPAGTYS